jgi:DNA processing protein
MAGALVGEGFGIVSGGAIGIDAAAHEGALAHHGVTVAILGSGLLEPYPLRNLDLFSRIATRGAVLSPFAPSAPPRRSHFPQRNRYIAACAQAVVVIEAPCRSGALNTARWAKNLGVPVMAMRAGQGAIGLLLHGASLVDSAQDVIHILRGGKPRHMVPLPEEKGDGRAVLTIMQKQGECSLDELARHLGWRAPRTAAALIQLELAGWIQSRPGCRYALTQKNITDEIYS